MDDFEKKEQQPEQEKVEFDINPKEDFEDNRPLYPPRQETSPMRIFLGIIVMIIVISLTYYAFKGQPDIEGKPASSTVTADSGQSPASVAEATLPIVPIQDQGIFLPEKVADAADFSPTPETIAAAEASVSSLAGAASSSKSSAAPRPAGKSGEVKAEAKKTAAPKAAAEGKSAKGGTGGDKKTDAQSAKAAEKDTAVQSENKSDGKQDENKKAGEPAVKSEKADEKKNEPAEQENMKTDGEQAAPVSASSDIEDKMNLRVDVKERPSAQVEGGSAGQDKTEESSMSASGEESKSAEAPKPAPLAISDKWAVNISSTPDAGESLKLLTRLLGNRIGGQVYAYEVSIDGKTNHRIRVGFFNTKAEAEAVGQKIFEEFSLTSRPWAVQPTVEEVDRYGGK